jgi:Tat protein secretion system quality control protein TatD with DNase activity
VRHVAEEVARLKNLDFESVASATTANFAKLFDIN